MSTIQIVIIALLVVNIAVSIFMLYKKNQSEAYDLPAEKTVTWADGFGGYGTKNEFKTYSGCNCVGAGLKNNQNMTNDSQLYADSQYQHY